MPGRKNQYRYGCGKPKFNMSISSKSKHMRRWLVKHPWVRPMITFNYSAILIQAVYRGYRCRNKPPPPKLIKTKSKKTKPTTLLSRYLQLIQSYRTRPEQKPHWIDGGFSEYCAAKIQSLFRMWYTLYRLKRQRSVISQVAAIIIQMKVRSILRLKHQRSQIEDSSSAYSFKTPDMCILQIQNAWRNYCSRKIFRFYKQLVTEKLSGAPYDLLRNIIPREVNLLDKAAGIHIRFRLGGRTFPPKVYFKIFTHRPLCDVGAFAPRDYKSEVLHKKDLFLHNKREFYPPSMAMKTQIRVGAKYFSTVMSGDSRFEEWYAREDGNNWRPIATETIEDNFDGGSSRLSKSRRAPFHYSHLRRKQDLVAFKKRKQREWMLKAYQIAQGLQEKSFTGRYDSLID